MSSSCCSQHSNQYFTFTNFFFFFCFSVRSLSGMTGIKAGTAVVLHTTGSPKPVSCVWWELRKCQIKGAFLCFSFNPRWWNFTPCAIPKQMGSKPDFLEPASPFSYQLIRLSHSLDAAWKCLMREPLDSRGEQDSARGDHAVVFIPCCYGVAGLAVLPVLLLITALGYLCRNGSLPSSQGAFELT